MTDNAELTLSSHALEALKEFAVNKGISFNEMSDIRKEIQEALDIEPKEDSFEYHFGNYCIQLKGLRRDIGQTLASTGLTLWRAGDFLSQYIYENQERLKNKRIIEDGDDDTLNLLRENCALNGIKNIEHVVEKLIWGDNDVVQLGKFDVILGADIIYENEQIQPLFDTASELLASNGFFWLAYTKRNVSIDDVLGYAKSIGLKWIEPKLEEGIYEFYRE